MMESIYGQRFAQAQQDITNAARQLLGLFGGDPALAQAVERVSGQNERLRALFRMEAVAALLSSIAQNTAALEPQEGGGVIETAAGLDMLVSLRAVLGTPDLTKTSRAALIAAFGDPDAEGFGEEEEADEGEEPNEPNEGEEG